MMHGQTKVKFSEVFALLWQNFFIKCGDLFIVFTPRQISRHRLCTIN